MSQPLLSRVADSVYWMSRYIERAENVARVVDVNLHLLLDMPFGGGEQWSPLVDTSGDAGVFKQRFGKEATRENVVHFLTADATNPNSILSCLRSARENARTVRDTVSSEMWEQANKMYLSLQDALGSNMFPESLQGVFYDVKMNCHLFQGITDSTMSHGEAWHFIQLGRMLERADKTTRILDVKYFLLLPSLRDVGTSVDDIQWSAVLKSVSGFEMYRKKHGRLTPDDIVEFLLLDSDFPRAVRHCLRKAAESLRAITGTPVGSFANPAEQWMGHTCAELDYADVSHFIGRGLHESLDALQSKLNQIDDGVYETFFAMRPLANLTN
ncbi:MAG: alpha-E domain-containing protein [Bryobacterales bacterium]|nr:alpha-E domain-containing protein [Bryobacterales bacterium]